MKNFLYLFIIIFAFIYSSSIYAIEINDCSNVIYLDAGEIQIEGICIDDEYKNFNKIILIILILISIIYFLTNFIRIKINVNHLTFNLLYIYSLFFSLFYLFWSLNNVNDSISYYAYALNYDYPLKLGAMFIANINDFFINNFRLRYFEINFIYFFFNILSLIIFSKIIYDPILSKERPIDYFFYIFFLFSPSLNFWISGINKESITFLGIVGLILSFQNKKIIFSLIFISLIILVRPYIFFLLFFSYLAYLFIKFNKKTLSYLLILILLVIVFLVMHKYQVFLRIPFDVLSLDSIIEFIDSRQNKLFEGGHLNLSIKDSNFLFLLFSYLFRPSIFEVNNLFYMIVAIDNLFILLFVIYRLFFCIKFKFKISSDIVFISLIFFTITLLLLTLTSTNLGIALRQKWMILPFLIILLSDNYKKNKL